MTKGPTTQTTTPTGVPFFQANPGTSATTGTTRNPTATADGLSYALDKNGNPVYLNPYGLGENLGTANLTGISEFIYGLMPTGPATNQQTAFGLLNPQTGPSDTSTADRLMQQFLHLDPARLAQIQSQLYRAGGYYPANFVPDYGQLRNDDIGAFRQFLIGVASNPTQGPVGAALSQQAAYGDKQGVNLRNRAPLVVKLTSPDDIRAAADKAALDLYGGKLSEEEMQKFIASYQGLEGTYQAGAYALGDPALTGVLGAGAGGVVTQPPSLSTAATNTLRADHPDQIFLSQLGQQIGGLLPSLVGTTPGAQTR